MSIDPPVHGPVSDEAWDYDSGETPARDGWRCRSQDRTGQNKTGPAGRFLRVVGGAERSGVGHIARTVAGPEVVVGSTPAGGQTEEGFRQCDSTFSARGCGGGGLGRPFLLPAHTNTRLQEEVDDNVDDV